MKKPLKKFFVKPGEFGSVRDPVSFRFLKDEGEWKVRNSYWLRRVKQGDVVEATPPKEEKPKTEVKAAPKKGNQS